MEKYISNEAKQHCVLGVVLFGLGHQRTFVDNEIERDMRVRETRE